MSLTEIKVRQANYKDKIYFLSDEDGLSLKVEPNGRKYWCARVNVYTVSEGISASSTMLWPSQNI